MSDATTGVLERIAIGTTVLATVTAVIFAAVFAAAIRSRDRVAYEVAGGLLGFLLLVLSGIGVFTGALSLRFVRSRSSRLALIVSSADLVIFLLVAIYVGAL